MLAHRIAITIGFTLFSIVDCPAQFTATKIVETNVAYPGFGTLTSLVVRPSLSGPTIAFGGNLTTGPALATINSGTITTLATNTTSVPGGSGNFIAFNTSPIGISGAVATFAGNGIPAPNNSGAFSNVIGSLTPVVAAGMAYPGGGSFTGISAAAVSGTTFAFSGTNSGNFPTGVFTRIGTGALVTIATTTTTIPGTTSNFTQFVDPMNGPILPNISGSNIVFGGTGSGRTGLYTTTGGPHFIVADTTIAIPGGTGNFQSFGVAPAISGSNIAFQAAGSGGQAGIYRYVNNTLSRVVSTATIVPGTSVPYQSFLGTDVAIAGDRVAFRGTALTGQSGIYTDLSGTLQKVIATNESFDGKIVSNVNIGQFSFEGNKIAVMVTFSNNSYGVYTFTPVPEEPGIFAIALALLIGLRWIR